MNGATDQIKMILARDFSGAWALWACRGEGKGCPRNRYRKRAAPCADCVGPLPYYWTLGQVADHLARGDA